MSATAAPPATIGQLWADQLAGAAAAAELLDVDQADELAGLADLAAGVVLPIEHQLGELRRKPYPCPACQLGTARPQQRGMRITNNETGEVVHDSTPGGRDAA